MFPKGRESEGYDRRYGGETVIPETVNCFEGVHAMVTCRNVR